MFHIYKATSSTSGKSYIGVTTQTLERRWYLHCWNAKQGSGCHFHHAIAKYGTDDFHIEHLFSGWCDRTQIERHFIKEHGTYQNGYNMTVGGEDFTNSEYQRELQLTRVANGTHPFIGGSIQRRSGKHRWEYGTNPLIGVNERRVANGTHNFIGEHNPQRQLAREGKHHNQQSPWLNTNVSAEQLYAWSIADRLYEWYQANNHRKRGGSYKAMAKAFGLSANLQVMYYRYFRQGWVPNQDPAWLEWAKCTVS